jgi:uncharacterized protein (TIGR02466 family)
VTAIRVRAMSDNSEGTNAQAGNLYREIFFPTFIFYKDLSDSVALNAALGTAIYAMREADADGLHRSNVKQAGAWHSQDDLNRRPEFAGLVAKIQSATQSVFNDLSYDPAFEPFIDNMWANISPKNAFNRTHVHPGVTWSGVYYVQTPENCGRIYFSDPRVQAQMLRPHIHDEGRKQAHNWTEVFYQPIAGRLILFPAWLQHEVEPNLSEATGEAGNRISISFNFLQRRRKPD